MPYCSNCGKEVQSNAIFCANCGIQIAPSDTRIPTPTATSPLKVSRAWWLLPLFLGIIGGLLAWLGVKDKDRRKASRLLLFGGLLTVFTVVVMLIGTLSYETLLPRGG